MKPEKEKIKFRKQAEGSIQTPDELSDYLHVTVPGVWMILIAVILLLLGIFVWGIYGAIETHDEAAVEITDTTQLCYVPERDLEAVLANKTVEIDGQDYALAIDTVTPMLITQDMNIYVMLAGHMKLGDYVYPIPIEDCHLKPGAYQGHLKTETIKPFSFMTNQ